jgi:hypothetical protein
MGWEEVASGQRTQVNCWWRPNVSGINECRKLVRKRGKINTSNEIYLGVTSAKIRSELAANASASVQG